MAHRLIREDERDSVYSDFAEKHAGHLSALDVSAGDWALVFHCPICHQWETFEVDNEARRDALKLRGRVAS